MHARDVVERLAISLGGEVEHTDGQTVIRWPKYIGYSASERWAWQHMLKRCTDPKHPAWDRYGGRGIKVCDRWANSFAAFAEDRGIETREFQTGRDPVEPVDQRPGVELS